MQPESSNGMIVIFDRASRGLHGSRTRRIYICSYWRHTLIITAARMIRDITAQGIIYHTVCCINRDANAGGGCPPLDFRYDT
jgi:hypothetical protein